MRDYFKRHFYEIAVLLIIVTVMCMVYLVKGSLGGLAWTAALFVLGPLGTLIFIIQVVVFIIRLFKRKKTRLLPMAATLLLAFPVLVMTGVVFIPYPDQANASEMITLSMPVKGDIVLFGGEDYRTHAVWPSERYAYDILVTPYDTGATDLQAYGIYGKDIYAPMKGEVIEVHDGEADIAPNIEEFTSLLGNYIYMRIEETDTYLILAHLKSNSIRVNEGDLVEPGTIIAQVGNSGTTSEPHLHIQHQRNDPRKSILMIADEGLPIRFE